MYQRKQKKNCFSVNVLIRSGMLKRRMLANSAISNNAKGRQFINIVK